MAGFSRGHSSMPLAAQQSNRPRFGRLVTSAAYNNTRLPYTTAGTPAAESRKVETFLRSPFDIAAFAPRLALGALLSLPEVAQNLPQETDRLSMLLQDPRPPADKQQLIVEDLEARLASCLQRGASVEADVLTAMADLLPTDVQQQLPTELKDILLRGRTTGQVPTTPTAYEEVEFVPASTVAANQTAAEMVDLRGAVMSLREALMALSANIDPAQEGVLSLNVTDARVSLSRRLQQLTPAVLVMQDAPVAAATEEASILLAEVEALQL